MLSKNAGEKSTGRAYGSNHDLFLDNNSRGRANIFHSENLFEAIAS